MKTSMLTQLKDACGHRVEIQMTGCRQSEQGTLKSSTRNDRGFWLTRDDGSMRFFTNRNTEYVKIIAR